MVNLCLSNFLDVGISLNDVLLGIFVTAGVHREFDDLFRVAQVNYNESGAKILPWYVAPKVHNL